MDRTAFEKPSSVMSKDGHELLTSQLKRRSAEEPSDQKADSETVSTAI